jgi:hypothetical protein
MCVQILNAPIFNCENHTHYFSPQNTHKRQLNSLINVIISHYSNGVTLNVREQN